MTLRDPELLELLADKPELLAVADAVGATQKLPKGSLVRRPVTRFAAVAAVAAAAIAALLVLPQGEHGIVDRAIAAIGNGRVLHMVVDVPTGTTYANLRSGHRTVEHYRLEIWADQKLKHFHVDMSVKGKVLADILWPQDAKNGATLGPVDPAFTALWSGYRDALAHGNATRAGEGIAFGHHVYWLRFRSVNAKSPGSEVAVDAKTYKPIVLRSYTGLQAVDQHILLAETTDLAAADFTRHGPNPLLQQLVPAGGSSTSSGILGSQNAKPNTTVPRGWLTAGPKAAGRTLTAVVPLTVDTTNKNTVRGVQLVYGPLQYGLAAQNATTVNESPQPDDPQMWAHIPAGTVKVQQGSMSDNSGEHAQWTGYLIKNGRYITITTLHGEQALIEIAQSLRPAR